MVDDTGLKLNSELHTYENLTAQSGPMPIGRPPLRVQNLPSPSTLSTSGLTPREDVNPLQDSLMFPCVQMHRFSTVTVYFVQPWALDDGTAVWVTARSDRLHRSAFPAQAQKGVHERDCEREGGGEKTEKEGTCTLVAKAEKYQEQEDRHQFVLHLSAAVSALVLCRTFLVFVVYHVGQVRYLQTTCQHVQPSKINSCGFGMISLQIHALGHRISYFPIKGERMQGLI